MAPQLFAKSICALRLAGTASMSEKIYLSVLIL